MSRDLNDYLSIEPGLMSYNKSVNKELNYVHNQEFKRKGLNQFRTVVSELSTFVGNSLLN